MAFFFILFTLSSIGLPGLNGFVSEFLTILGAFTSRHLGIGYGVVAATGIVLGAIYMLHMAARVIWGPLKTPGAHDHHGHGAAHAAQPDAGQGASPDHTHGDLNGREVAILIPLAVLVLVLGVFPNLVLKTIERPIQLITKSDEPVAQPIRRPVAAAVAPEATLAANPTGEGQ
jgi:NADH-quinone oxidoreductase subunit M